MYTYFLAGKQFVVSIFKYIYNWYSPPNQTTPLTDDYSFSAIAPDTLSSEAKSIDEPISESAEQLPASGKKNRDKRGKKNKKQKNTSESQTIETTHHVIPAQAEDKFLENASDTLFAQAKSIETPVSEPQQIKTEKFATIDESEDRSGVSSQIEVKVQAEKIILQTKKTSEIMENEKLNQQGETTDDKSEDQVPHALSPQVISTQGLHGLFAPQFNLPVNNGECSIERSKLPSSLLATVYKIREEFPEARLFLTGAAPANLIDNIKPNDYDILIIGASSKNLLQYLRKLQIQSELRGIKYPVVFAKVDDEVSIDFCVNENLQQELINNVLMRDYMRRDLNLNALYLEFTESEQFSVFSYLRSLTLKQQKIIETLAHPYFIFCTDPSRVFRLLKSMLENPRYTLSSEIEKTLLFLGTPASNGVSLMMNLFALYVAQDPGNRGRLNQCIRKVFNRFSYEEINKGLDKLGLLQLLTNNNLYSAQKACKKIPIVDKEDKFIYWILANSLQHAEDTKSRQLIPMKQLLALNQPESALLSFTNAHILHKTPRLHVFTKGVLELINSFDLVPVKTASWKPK